MIRARWITAAVTLFGFWLIGAGVLMPQMQRELEAAAHRALAQQATLVKRLGRVSITFEGQQAHLTGSVRTIADRRRIETVIRDLVRVPTPLTARLGLRLNPVSAVHNEIEIDPCPSGWMLLAATGARARLLGTAANDYEARDLARSVQEGWRAKGGVVEGALGIDGENHDEAANVSATLRGVPEPNQTVQAHLVRIGQPWKEISLQQPDDVLLAEARTLGITAFEWQDHVLPTMRELRHTLQQQRAAAVEDERLAKLPLSHLFIAVRDRHVTLRGEVDAAAMKHRILDQALAVFAPRRLLDEIRVSPQRRPTGEFDPITPALLPSAKAPAGQSLFLGFSGGSWQPVDWRNARAWNNDLPAAFDSVLLQNDRAALIDWLQGTDTHEPAPLAQSPPALITLALFDSKAILSGQIAEESLRAQLIAAARQVYAARARVIHDDLRVHGNCQPVPNGLQLLKSFPPFPAAHGVGILAVATSDHGWIVLPVTRELVEAGGLTNSHQLPVGVSAAQIEAHAAEAIEQLRLWISNRQPPTAHP